MNNYTPRTLGEYNLRQTIKHMQRQGVPQADLVAALRAVTDEQTGKEGQ